MNAFVRVVESGTFTKAADTLDLPPASVTRLIQWLEDDLKVRLLHRTTRSVTVTPEGAVYYEQVVRLLADLAAIEAGARDATSKPAGCVRVETAPAMAAMVLVPALETFFQQYPDVIVELTGTIHLADLVSDGADCAIRMGEISDPSLVARRIGDFQFITCATAELLSKHGSPLHPRDLETKPTLGLVASRSGKAHPYRFGRGSRVVEASPAHRMVLSDTNAYLAAGLAGLGVIQAPNYAVLPHIAERRLVQILEDWATDPMPVSVVYPPNRYLSAKVRVFIDWVVALFEKHEQLQRMRR